MKKRKVKLFASIASLALVTAVMGVGVWAATQQAVKISSEVNFVATSIAAEVKLAVNDGESSSEAIVDTAYITASDAGDTAGLPTTSDAAVQAVTVADFDIVKPYDEYESKLWLTLKDGNNDGYVTKGALITYTFTMLVDTDTPDIFYKLTVNLKDTGLTSQTIGDVTITKINELFKIKSISDSVDGVLAGTDGTAVKSTTGWGDDAAGQARTLKITFEVLNDYAYSMSHIALADIDLELANALDNFKSEKTDTQPEANEG